MPTTFEVSTKTDPLFLRESKLPVQFRLENSHERI
jgi:hypothetical protein